MENKKSEKNHISGSKVIKLQADEESTMISENIVDDKENTNSSVINKGKNDIVVVQEKNDLKTPSSPTGKDLGVINIKQEKLALNSVESPTEPSATETNTAISKIIKNDDLEDKKLKYTAKLAEIGEVREENERLKLLLAQILKDYQSLKSHFVDILRHQEAKEEDELKPKDHKLVLPSDLDHRKERDESDQLLVSLSLGRASSNGDEPRNKSIEKKTSSESVNISGKDRGDSDNKARDHEGIDKLALALGSSLMSQSFDRDRHKEDDHLDQAEPTEIWPPSKVLKRPNGGDDHEDGASQMSPLKKARVSVRTRCDAPTMNDGCQWRKYGQKISKGNPCPRAYYRCRVSPTCPVRKQVQRCAEDMSILITTYEGTHNHSLSISATAMASTTAAAASMLQSRSATSSSQLATTSATSAPIINSFTSNNPNNPLLINNNRSISSSPSIALPSQVYLPNTSISTCNSHPTVTLDLTTLPNPNQNNSLQRRSSLPRYPSTCLSFTSSSSSTLDLPNIMNNVNYNSFNFGNVMAQARNYQIGSQLVTNNKQPCQDQVSSNFFHPYSSNIMVNNNNIANNNDQDSLMSETIAAATKAITANPKFQSALAAVLTSFVGNGGGGSGNGV